MFDFFQDLISASRQNSLEKMKSPFLGAFVFSWLAFNWQSIAILFFSKNSIEDRISFITLHHDVGGFILAPILTSILICILLPQATKVIIKMQSKPISDATLTTMSEKIALAEKQLEIADIESKKRLSDKREERRIEENIDNIKRHNADLIKTNNDHERNLNDIRESLNNAIIDYKTLDSQLSLATEQNKLLSEKNIGLEERMHQENEEKRKLYSNLSFLTTQTSKLESVNGVYANQIDELKIVKEESESRIKFLEHEINSHKEIIYSLYKQNSIDFNKVIFNNPNEKSIFDKVVLMKTLPQS